MNYVANNIFVAFLVWLLASTLCIASKSPASNIKSNPSFPESVKNKSYYELEGSSRVGASTYEARRRRRSATSGNEQRSRNPFSSMFRWIKDNQSSLPRVQVRVEPTTTLKLRKRFRPLFKTVSMLVVTHRLPDSYFYHRL